MNYHFIYSSDYFNVSLVEETFRDEADSMAEAGFTYSTLSDGLILASAIPESTTVVYRGWMLDSEQYYLLTHLIEKRGAEVFTDHTNYLLTHHLPNWYKLISEMTPDTQVYDIDANLPQELSYLKKCGWAQFFIKDYVKSLKTSVGSIIKNPESISTIISEMRRFRGTIEGGICVRKVEDFIPDTEIRYFVLNGRVYSPYTLTERVAEKAEIELVEEVANRINSPFFSVDVVKRADGVHRIVEVGDGQVSDLVGWSKTQFVNMWLKAGDDRK